jgi:hypothetical protein
VVADTVSDFHSISPGDQVVDDTVSDLHSFIPGPNGR